MLCCKNAIRANTFKSVFRTARSFTVCQQLQDKPLPPRRVIAETDLSESFLKGSGPGGQKINKTSSAVQLKHIPTGIVVKSQATRSRDQNRKIARRLLSDRLEEIEKGSESRTAIKLERAQKKKASATKKTRRKYKRLEDEIVSAGDGEETSKSDVSNEQEDNRPPSGSYALKEATMAGDTHNHGIEQDWKT